MPGEVSPRGPGPNPSRASRRSGHRLRRPTTVKAAQFRARTAQTGKDPRAATAKHARPSCRASIKSWPATRRGSTDVHAAPQLIGKRARSSGIPRRAAPRIGAAGAAPTPAAKHTDGRASNPDAQVLSPRGGLAGCRAGRRERRQEGRRAPKQRKSAGSGAAGGDNANHFVAVVASDEEEVARLPSERFALLPLGQQTRTRRLHYVDAAVIRALRGTMIGRRIDHLLESPVGVAWRQHAVRAIARRGFKHDQMQHALPKALIEHDGGAVIPSISDGDGRNFSVESGNMHPSISAAHSATIARLGSSAP